jgi:hypothetical protein
MGFTWLRFIPALCARCLLLGAGAWCVVLCHVFVYYSAESIDQRIRDRHQ